jgi:hypothetical protein
MGNEAGRLLGLISLGLMALASIAVEVAINDARPFGQNAAAALTWVAVALAAGRWLRPAAGRAVRPPWGVTALLVAVGAAAFIVEPFRREWTGQGTPLELRLVVALRNFGLGLAACGGWRVCRQAAVVVSLFLMLFAAAMCEGPVIVALLGVYAFAGGAWLMMAHWAESRPAFVAPTLVARTARVSARFPWGWAAAGGATLAAAVALAAFGPRGRPWQLGEWAPTSGGTGAYDPFSRGGVNDGDDETNGANPNSVGMIRSDTFLDSPLPSLYDMFNDLYGKPPKPKDAERAIALAGQENVVRPRGRVADQLRPTRVFDTRREGPKRPRSPGDRKARAIFEIEGRTPLHVRVVAYDAYAGGRWREAPINPHSLGFEKEKGRWLAVRELMPPSLFAGPEAHAIKITAPEGSWLPTPPYLERFRVGLVDRPEFFSFAHDRVLRFASRQTPPGITVETVSRVVDPERLAEARFSRSTGGERFDYHVVPADLDPRVAGLATAWAGALPPGMDQIAAVIRRLREGRRLDAAADTRHDDPVFRFLFDGQPGPDYMFASAGALMLRCLGYRTRLVSGFYAHPDRFDPETRHTPVTAEDVHFWPEVMLANGDWLVLEPTPGYETLRPAAGLLDRVLELASAVLRWCAARWVVIALGTVVVAILWAGRRVIADRLALLWWTYGPARTPAEMALGAVRLLERRARWGGQPRAGHLSPARWLRGRRDPTLDDVAAVAELAAYAPATRLDPSAVRPACARALKSWPLRRWRLTAKDPVRC